MTPAPRWITISAASALGLGMLATGAVGVANAMPLVDSTTTAEVPPISTVPGSGTSNVKGSGDVTIPLPASSPDVTSSAEPSATPTVQPAAPPPPQAVSPENDSAASPASVESGD